MAYAEQSTGLRGPINEHASALAHEWRRLTRAATFVALLTAPAFFLVLYDSNHLGLLASLLLTALAVVLFRGLVEVIARRFLPWPSLYGAGAELKEEDIVARRRYWYWRAKYRRLPIWIGAVLVLLALCQALFAFAGVSAGFFNPFAGLRTIFPPDTLPQLALIFVQLPLLLFINVFILFGPFLFMAARGIRSYEPGDASWGVKIDDVRGQAEAKEEITRVITLWQSGEEFEKAGGKRERGLLFLGAPGTGKTMISKAIATNFNCPFVTIPGSGFAQMFMGMDALVVQLLAHRARKLARKWGGQCIVFIDEIDAVGLRRQSLGTSMTAGSQSTPSSIHDFLFFGASGAITPTGDVVIETRQWRDQLFSARAGSAPVSGTTGFLQRVSARVNAVFPGGMGGMGYQGQALNQLLVVMDGMGEPPVFQKFMINRFNTFLDALFVVPQRIGSLRLRLSTPKPRREEIYFIGACNVPIEALDPALTRPGRMGRHIWFRTPTKDDRKDIFDLYMAKVAHEPDLDTDHRRDELARITGGYSPSMIEQCCSMALTIAHSEGRHAFAWRDIVEAMTTVESGTAQNIEYVEEETRAVAIHEAGHAAAGHVFLGNEVLSTRLSIRKRGGSLGHYQSMEKDERFSHFRGRVMGSLIMTLGAMAAEHVFYGENSQGVSGDLYSATATASAMVGMWGMGPEELPISLRPSRRLGPGEQPDQRDRVKERLEEIGNQIMNRASGGSPLSGDPISAVLSSPGKRDAVAQLLGQAYVMAYSLIATNREAIEQIADELMERREMHGDEVGNLLDRVGLVRPQVDLYNDATWPGA
ncbi:AAA family ATPase [Conexibacter sp. S30A1]|uniref:AAA family ATPase n=1 Tax=Conexibacter sp. S30A1 TaxID=2937800 RepID=UPI00200FA5F0|nr:AAA family ATPase [Conexibacter sp. S30A1]